MKHASEERLREIGPLLVRLRKFAELKEKKLGVFYRKSGAFVHFHDDAAGMFGDLRTKGGWKRLAVNSAADVKAFCKEVEQAILGE
jgi:hypothetical protein